MFTILNKAIVAMACLASLSPVASASADQDKLSKKQETKPNFIFILTDDQDLLMDSLSYQSAVQEHLVDQGTTFTKHYCTIAVCCPSRVSLMTGRAAHNTNVTSVREPYGGYPKFVDEGWNDDYLPVWLQEEGYNTYYTGKLFNGLSLDTWNDPKPKGWTSSNWFLDPTTYVFYNVTTQKDSEEPVSNPDIYSTDIVANSTIAYLDDAIEAGEPFFIGVAPIGPHSETINSVFYPPVPADRHADLHPGLQVPRTANFNPDVASGGGWIKTLEKLNETTVEYLDEFYRLRILTLYAIDEMVTSIMDRLSENPEVLENTYIIYTTDNGFHVGQHRLGAGKTCGIEEDINIPFIVRGPGVAQGATYSGPTSHTDIVPTLFELAGIELQDGFDGVPMPITTAQQESLVSKTEHVQVEFWGNGLLEGLIPPVGEGVVQGVGINNTYKTLRVISDDYDLSYTVWCTGDHELYDMATDPGRMNNLYPASNATADDSSATISNGWAVPVVTNRLDALLLTLKACSGPACREPWTFLHPEGGVATLSDAMNIDFDQWYSSGAIGKVEFSLCAQGYIEEYEMPLHPIPYTEVTATAMEARWEDYY